MVDKNNRSIPWAERPMGMAVGNNKNTRTVRHIKTYLEKEGPSSFSSILDYLNENWRWGVTRAQLSNILGKGPFQKVGETMGGGFAGTSAQGVFDNL